MLITIFSALDGEASGYITVTVPSDFKIGDLIKLYCVEKDIKLADDYALCGKGNTILNPLKTIQEEGICDNDNLKLTQDDKTQQLFGFGSWWVLSFVAFFIGSVGLSFTLYTFYSSPKIPLKYGLIVDAGSTHSTLYLFSWTTSNSPMTTDIELIHNCTMLGGVSDFRSNTDGLLPYFQKCLNETEDLILNSQKPHSPLALAATAGMRILQHYEPESANLVLSVIREIFLTTKFKKNPRDVFILTGEEEGIAGWLAVNFLLQKFNENQESNYTTSDLKTDVVSTLDLGGASVEVTTPLSKLDAKNWQTTNVTVFKNKYRVHGKSFMCYGVVQAMHRYQYFLIKGHKSSKVVPDPCLPNGIQITLTEEDFTSPCLFSEEMNISRSILFPTKLHRNFNYKYMKDFQSIEKLSDMVSLDPNETYLLKGINNAKACETKVKSLFNTTVCESFLYGSCLYPNELPLNDKPMVAFSPIFRILMPLIGAKEKSMNSFEQAVMKICSLTAVELRKMYPNISNTFVSDICFDSMYVYTLLKNGIGITPKLWDNLIFQSKFGGRIAQWPLGLQLNRTWSFEAAKPVEAPLGMLSFIVMLALFVIFIGIGITFLWYTVEIKKRGNVYQRVFSHVLDP